MSPFTAVAGEHLSQYVSQGYLLQFHETEVPAIIHEKMHFVTTECEQKWSKPSKPSVMDGGTSNKEREKKKHPMEQKHGKRKGALFI